MFLSRTLLRRHSVLPGFGLALGFTLLYLSLIVLIPLSAAFLKTFTHDLGGVLGGRGRAARAGLVPADLRRLACSRRCVNAVFGLIVAWVLVRYEFPGKRVVDALVDLPFALPTAVAGIALTALYARNGWIGQLLEPLGIKVAFTPLGVLVALIFIGLPFVVRTVQPVLEDLEQELEEAAATLGATPLADLHARDLPDRCSPALLTGFALAFARALGEYGSVIFIAGNMPMVSEITPLLIITKLEQYDYAGATAIAVVMLLVSFVLLLAINVLQAWTRSAAGGAEHERRRHHAAASHAARAAAARASRATAEPAWVRRAADRRRARLPRRCSCSCRWSRCSSRRFRRAAASTSRRSPSPMRCSAIRLTLLAAAHRGAAEPGVRRRRGLGDRQVRLPRQEPADHADRPAVLGLAGDRRPDLRAAVRRAGLVRRRGCATTTSRSSSRCPASCWRPSSSPSRSSRAS